jgi:hypothetical protein
MVMREPLSVLVRDLSQTGIGTAAVQLEVIRVAVVLLFLTRQFLAAGVYFDRVYLQPESAVRFPRRSYPVDFISRMAELLVAVAASTAVGIHTRYAAGLAPFTMITALLLLLQPLWFLQAKAAHYTAVSEIAPIARANLWHFALGAAIYFAIYATNLGPAKADAIALLAVVVLIATGLATQIRDYGHATQGKA